MHFLTHLFERWSYVMSEKTEVVDGAPCVVLQGKMQCALPVDSGSWTRSVSDKLWLDPEHGLAARKRETRIDGQRIRVINSELVEILPAVWLPERSRTESFAPADAAAARFVGGRANYLAALSRIALRQDRGVRVDGGGTYYGGFANDWRSLSAKLTTPPSKEAGRAESGVGDNQVRLYPVRTPLGRLLYGNDVDCVVHIIPPIDEADAEIVLTMQRSLPKLELKKKHRVLFSYRTTNREEANYRYREYCGEHVYKGLLGFETATKYLRG
ncbi:MAG: hypothetical protein ACYTG0_27715 [Planctomycetota bacterium]|jgi:hypothetical protein